MSNAIPRWGLIAALAALFGIVAGALLLRSPIREITSGTLLERPRPVAEFTLQNADGSTFTRANLAGHLTVIFPGFTFCPDVCPTTLVTLKAVREKLGADAAKTQIVFLSVDPERDTPDKLKAYTQAFSPDFLGVTGDIATLERLSANLGFVFDKAEGATPDTYTIDHSAALILIGPDARLLGYFTPPYKVDALVADLHNLVHAS